VATSEGTHSPASHRDNPAGFPVVRLVFFFHSMSDWDTAPITLRKRVPKSSTLKTEKVKPVGLAAYSAHRAR